VRGSIYFFGLRVFFEFFKDSEVDFMHTAPQQQQQQQDWGRMLGAVGSAAGWRSECRLSDLIRPAVLIQMSREATPPASPHGLWATVYFILVCVCAFTKGQNWRQIWLDTPRRSDLGVRRGGGDQPSKIEVLPKTTGKRWASGSFCGTASFPARANKRIHEACTF